MEALWPALVVAVPAVIVPLLTQLLTSRHRRLEKKEDWARQDEVAARLIKANERVAISATKMTEKLETIHTLVNSGLTAEKQAVYEATRRELVLLVHIIDLNKAAGREPTAEELGEIDATKKRIKEMRDDLDDREMRAKIVTP